MALSDLEQDPQLRAVIADARKNRIPDDIIETTIRRELTYQREATPPPKPSGGALKGFASGAVKGLTLGYADLGETDSPLAEALGVFTGGAISAIPVFKGVGLGVGAAMKAASPLARALTTEGVAGAGLGAAWEAPDLESRLESAAMGGVLTPAIGSAIRGVGRLFKGKPTTPTVTDPEALKIAEAKAFIEGQASPEDKVTRITDLQALLRGQREGLKGPVLEGEPGRELVPVKTGQPFAMPPISRTMPSGKALPAPPDFRVTPGGSVTPSLANAETAMLLERMGKAPKPGEPVTDAQLEAIADLKGWDLVKSPDGTYRAVGSGGKAADFATAEEAAGFLSTTPLRVPQPIEIKTPIEDVPQGTGGLPPRASTFDKMVDAGSRGKKAKLTKADRENLQSQREKDGILSTLEKQADSAAKPHATVGDLFRGRSMVGPDQPVLSAFQMPLSEVEAWVRKPVASMPQELKQYLQMRAEEEGSKLAQGEPGGRVFEDNPTGPGLDVTGYGSTYPKWYGELGRNKADVLKSLERLQRGEEKTELDRHLKNTVLWDAQDFEKWKDALTLPVLKPMGGGAEATGRMAAWRPEQEPQMINPLAQPQLSGSPLINALGDATSRAEASMKFELGGWWKYVNENLRSVLGDDPATRQKAFRYVQGELPAGQAGSAAVAAGTAYRTAMKEFAGRLGLPEWENYATHLTDFDALYQTMRERFMGMRGVNELGLDDAGEAWLKLKIGNQRSFDTLRTTMLKAPHWSDLSRSEQKALKDLWNFDAHLDTWEQLPGFIKKRLPKEVFMPYLLERKGGVPVIEDLVQAFERYVPVALRKIHYDPVVQEFEPKLRALPGSEMPYTPKGYGLRYLDRVIKGNPTWDERAITDLTNVVNKTFGKELVNLGQAHAATTLLRSGAYRGLIGLDSAVINLTQTINTVAETGRFMGPMLKFVQNFKQDRQRAGLFGEFLQSAREWEGPASSTTMQKVLAADEWLNKIALSPMSMTEFINRGLAFEAGVEEAVAKGLSRENALVNGLAKASKIVPNLEIPETWAHAIFQTIPKTQFGAGLSAQRSPYLRGPLGRLSTILLTYPTQQTQFMFRGFADAMKQNDKAKLIRFTAALGVFAGLPTILASAGIDIRKQFGIQGVLGQLTIPMWQMMGNGYQAVMGSDPITRDQAAEDFKKALIHLTVPQSRYGEKVMKVMDNVERGYAVDAHGRFLYETTPAGELLRLVGPAPEVAHDTRALSKEIVNQSLEHWLDRRKAIEGMLDQQDPAGMQLYMQKWGRSLTMKDLMKAQQDRMKSPEQRALQRFPKNLRPRVYQEAQEETEGLF